MGLLYDQLCFEAVSRGRTPATGFLSLPVYEISQMLWLAIELSKSDPVKQNQIPKRPPHRALWVEWARDEVITRPDSSEVRANVSSGMYWVESQKIDWSAEQEAVFSDRKEFVHFYNAISFRRWNTRDVPGSTELGRIVSVGVHHLIGFTEDWSRCLPCGQRTDKSEGGFFGLALEWGHNPEKAAEECWWPLMAFGLLHCRNVRTELIPGAPQKPRHARQGLPAPASYHTLRLELPNKVRPRGVESPTDEEARKVRFHLCRGHFKNLQHERYKEKGWHWWPAHWRGDPDLGEVVKDYELRGEQ